MSESTPKRKRRSVVEAEVQEQARKQATSAGSAKPAGAGRTAMVAAQLRADKGLEQPEPLALGERARTKYKPELCHELIEYFDGARTWWTNYTEKGSAQILPKDKIPTFGKFARKRGFSVFAMYDWIERYPDFALAYAEALDIQKEFLIELATAYPGSAGFAMFLLKSTHGMREPTAGDNLDDDDAEISVNATGPGQAK